MIETLQKLISDCNARDRLVIKLLAMLALAPRQICALQRNHYRSNEHQLFVPLVNRPTISQWVTLPDSLASEIEQWLQENKDTTRFFALTPKRVNQIVTEAGKSSGLKISPRDLRKLTIDRLLVTAEFSRFSGSAYARIKSVDIYNDDRDNFLSKQAFQIEKELNLACVTKN